MVVQVMMVEGVEYFFHRLFDGSEIDPHTKIIKAIGLDGCLNFPVVAMGSFAVAWIVSQVMACGKMTFDENIEHVCSTSSLFFKM